MTKRLLAFFAVLFAATGLIASEITPEGMEQLKAEWLFQCDEEPTFEKAKLEIGYARDLADRISDLDDAPELDAELAQLDELEKKIDAATETDALAEEFYLAVRKVKREITFKNPLITFDKILLIDNPYPKDKEGDYTDAWGHEARHRNGFLGTAGGRLLVVGLNPGDEVVDVLNGRVGAFWRPDLSYDGKKVLFSFEPLGDKSFHLYECNLDGSGFKQLTFGDYDDLDPIYTPDGKITFCSSRQHSYVRCMPMTHSFAVSRCDADGKNIYVISASGEPEYLPSMLNDGRVIFTRWEYTDKALWRVQSLWTMNPDGTNQQTFYGNQSTWPDVITEARAIPNSSKVIFTAVGHHAWFNGSIGIVDPTAGLNYPDGLDRVTREVAWPEVGNGPEDPAPKVDYHESGKIYAYKTPYPLSEEYFLVSAREGGHLYGGPHNDWYFRLYLMDVYGNKELIYRGQFNAYHAIPVVNREGAYPVKPDVVKWPVIGSGEKPAMGELYSNNVFEGTEEYPELKENGKYIRVVQMDPKTYTTWHKTVQHDGPAVSVFQAEGVKRILGVVPIEEDGSVNFKVPAGEAFYFEMLDKDMRAIHVMRTFTNVMPGERRGCTGCHESQFNTQANVAADGAQVGKAVAKPAADLVPPSWGVEESISYKRFVQDPVVEKYCIKCHGDPENKAYQTINMTWRPSTKGWWGWVHHRPNDVSPFNEPYMTFVNGDTPWGGAKKRDEHNVPENIAGLFIVEAYDMNDPDNLRTLPPYSAFSPVSQLAHHALSGEHHGVKVEGEDAERLLAWIDTNGPYLGDEEIREMYDPDSHAIANVPKIRPRIATAPKINRFDIRQDGDTSAFLPPLKLMPETSEEFNPNDRVAEQEFNEIMSDLKSENVKVELLSARYGTEDAQIDVLDIVKKYFNGTRLLAPITYYNGTFTDPAQGRVKKLRVTYRINGGDERRATFEENTRIILPK